MPSVRLLLKLTIIAATSRSTRVFYDRVSPFYESVFTDHLPHIRTMAAALSERFPAQHQVKVLDMACGTGALSRRLEERGFSVTGLDFSFQSLRRLNQTTQTIRLIQADAAALPFSSGSFDVVTCMGAWRHFPNLSVFWTKSAECFALAAPFWLDIFLQNSAGYFQPRRAHSARRLRSCMGVLSGF